MMPVGESCSVRVLRSIGGCSESLAMHVHRAEGGMRVFWSGTACDSCGNIKFPDGETRGSCASGWSQGATWDAGVHVITYTCMIARAWTFIGPGLRGELP